MPSIENWNSIGIDWNYPQLCTYYSALESIRLALLERAAAVGETKSWSYHPETLWYYPSAFEAYSFPSVLQNDIRPFSIKTITSEIQSAITNILPFFVNHTASGNFHGKTTIPSWTESTILEAIGAESRLVNNIPNALSSAWITQQYKILNMLRYTYSFPWLWREKNSFGTPIWYNLEYNSGLCDSWNEIYNGWLNTEYPYYYTTYTYCYFNHTWNYYMVTGGGPHTGEWKYSGSFNHRFYKLKKTFSSNLKFSLDLYLMQHVLSDNQVIDDPDIDNPNVVYPLVWGKQYKKNTYHYCQSFEEPSGDWECNFLGRDALTPVIQPFSTVYENLGQYSGISPSGTESVIIRRYDGPNGFKFKDW